MIQERGQYLPRKTMFPCKYKQNLPSATLSNNKYVCNNAKLCQTNVKTSAEDYDTIIQLQHPVPAVHQLANLFPHQTRTPTNNSTRREAKQ